MCENYKYQIMFKLPGEYPEEIDLAKDIREANYLVNEYELAYKGAGKVYKRKIRQSSRPRPEFNI